LVLQLFLLTIQVQVNPHERHYTKRVIVKFSLRDIEPGYCDVLEYQPTTSAGTLTHGLSLGLTIGTSVGLGAGYSWSVTQPMVRVIDDSDLTSIRNGRIIWTTEYYYPPTAEEPSKHSHWTKYSVLLRCRSWEATQRGKLFLTVVMDECTEEFEYDVNLRHFHELSSYFFLFSGSIFLFLDRKVLIEPRTA